MGDLPSVLVAGAMKARTTWAHEALSRHPSVVLPGSAKELFYFDQNYDRGSEWYASQFPSGGLEHRIPVEVAATYFTHDQAPERVASASPEAKVVVLLRDPLDRAWSHYLHLWRKGDVRSTTTFSEAWLSHPEVQAGSEYADAWERWTRCFPRAQLFPLVLEDFSGDADLWTALQAAAGVPPIDLPAIEFRNDSTAPRSRLLTMVAVRTARVVRGTRLQAAARVAGRSRVRQVLYTSGHAGSQVQGTRPAWADDTAVVDALGTQVTRLSAALGRDLRDVWS
jgi:hypothetical protein